MKINIHAGHNPDGRVACGAVGILKESTEARAVASKLITYLRKAGHTVFDCTCDNGSSQADVLSRIVKKCNDHAVDLDVSIHFNAYNGKASGTEVLLYGVGSKASSTAVKTADEVSKALGIPNRGIKYRSDLYYLRNTKSPAMLIETCFVDNAKDAKAYNADVVAKAIFKGITGKEVVLNNHSVTVSSLTAKEATALAKELKEKGYKVSTK